jgi:hypothetical protein
MQWIPAAARLRTGFVLAVFATAWGQQPPAGNATTDVMLAAVSRDLSVLRGGIGPSQMSKPGTVDVEPVARVTTSGEWRPIPCKFGTGEGCEKFARAYLSKRHTYTVISTDGTGATIHAAPVTLSECYGYNGSGTYTGARIAKSAIAAGSTEFFDAVAPLRLVSGSEALSIRKALRALGPKRLDTVDGLKIIHWQPEGSDLLIVQRAYSDFADPNDFHGKFIFSIGHVEQGHFTALHWKQNTDDEQEQVLGTIRMKNGKEFLITSVTDPESQSFRIYGVREGRVVLVFEGGGSSC